VGRGPRRQSLALYTEHAARACGLHRSETRDLALCVDCGAELSPGRDRVYAFGVDAFLCYTCAMRRGGIYDEAHDRWVRDADTSTLETGEA
jgi:hypothetical protein